MQVCTIGAKALIIMTLSIKGLFVTLSKMALDMESCCAECHDIFTVMMSVIMLNVVMLHVVAPLLFSKKVQNVWNFILFKTLSPATEAKYTACLTSSVNSAYSTQRMGLQVQGPLC